MPQSGRLGFELFDKPNWAGSDFAEKVNYQRALEGELERTIQTLGEIEAARVHLVLPQESLFTEQEREAKASVVIKLKGGRLGDDAQDAITHLVASAVDNLKPENVTLINADGGMPILARVVTQRAVRGIGWNLKRPSRKRWSPPLNQSWDREKLARMSPWNTISPRATACKKRTIRTAPWF